MKRILSLILVFLFIFACTGCAKTAPGVGDGGSDVPESSAPEFSAQEPVDLAQGKTVACCMGTYSHPVHRIVQTGFMLKAEELGMNGIISGLDDCTQQELIDQWKRDIADNNVSGALIWSGDDSFYELMKELKQDGVYIVVPHFIHNYEYTREFIDKNMACFATTYGMDAADYILDKLIENGITTGSIGITVNYDNGAGYHFKQKILESGADFTVIDSILEGAALAEATDRVTKYIEENPDMVAGFGVTGGAPQSWAKAMENTGRTDLIVVGMDYTEINMDLVENGTIAALVCQPLFEEGAACAQTLSELYNGAVFNTSENTWLEELEAPVSDKDDIPYYRDIWQKMYDYFGEE